jgi:hypothetical protein
MDSLNEAQPLLPSGVLRPRSLPNGHKPDATCIKRGRRICACVFERWALKHALFTSHFRLCVCVVCAPAPNIFGCAAEQSALSKAETFFLLPVQGTKRLLSCCTRASKCERDQFSISLPCVCVLARMSPKCANICWRFSAPREFDTSARR